MSKPVLKGMASVHFELQLTIGESAARALEALAGYGDNEFLELFYAKLGQSYLKPHESALRELFSAVREQLPSQLYAVKEARGRIMKAAGAPLVLANVSRQSVRNGQ